MMIGFFGSYSEGLPPSKTPPCGAARSELDAEAEATVSVTVAVRISVAVAVMVAMVGAEFSRLVRSVPVQKYGG